jgi:hypothetical protein
MHLVVLACLAVCASALDVVEHVIFDSQGHVVPNHYDYKQTFKEPLYLIDNVTLPGFTKVGGKESKRG